MIETRKNVDRGWRGVRAILASQGEFELAAHVTRLLDGMPPPLTEKERLMDELRRDARDKKVREPRGR